LSATSFCFCKLSAPTPRHFYLLTIIRVPKYLAKKILSWPPSAISLTIQVPMDVWVALSGNSLLHLLSPQVLGPSVAEAQSKGAQVLCRNTTVLPLKGYAQPTTPKECLRPTLRSSWWGCWGYNFLASPPGFDPASVKVRQMYAQHGSKPGLRVPLYRGPSNLCYPWCLRWRLWEIRDYLLAYEPCLKGMLLEYEICLESINPTPKNTENKGLQ
jgi:hypothetical protein